MNKKIAFGLFVILFLVFWNVLDFLFATFVTRNGYQFNGMTDLAVPLAAGKVLLLPSENDDEPNAVPLAAGRVLLHQIGSILYSIARNSLAMCKIFVNESGFDYSAAKCKKDVSIPAYVVPLHASMIRPFLHLIGSAKVIIVTTVPFLSSGDYPLSLQPRPS